MPIRKLAILCFLILFIQGCGKSNNPDMPATRRAWQDISAGKLVIDVRRPDEFAAGHIEGAVNIPHTEIREKISGVTKDKGQIIVLYCRSGRRSNLAMQTLRDLGYKNAYNAGGYDELLKQKPN